MTPAVLAHLVRRKPYARRTTDRELTVSRPYLAPRPVYGALESIREDIILERLATLTAATDPWTAARLMFGGTR